MSLNKTNKLKQVIICKDLLQDGILRRNKIEVIFRPFGKPKEILQCSALAVGQPVPLNEFYRIIFGPENRQTCLVHPFCLKTKI